MKVDRCYTLILIFAAPGISVAELEGKIPPKFGKLQDEIPNTIKPIIVKLSINLKKFLFLV